MLGFWAPLTSANEKWGEKMENGPSDAAGAVCAEPSESEKNDQKIIF